MSRGAEIPSNQLPIFQREAASFDLNLEQPLFALTSQGKVVDSQDLRVSNIREFLVEVDGLLQEPEAILGRQILETTLSNSTEKTVVLPPQALLSPDQFGAYAYKFRYDGLYTNPTEDVYVFTSKDETIAAYGSRSSLCPVLANVPKLANVLKSSLIEPLCTGGVQPCLRQEVMSDQEKIRFPWFTQTDIELLAVTSPEQREMQEFLLDTYSCYQMVNSLRLAGIPVENICLRVNSYMEIIAPTLSDKVPWLEIESFGCKNINDLASRRTLDQTAESGDYQKLQEEALLKLGDLTKQFNISRPVGRFFTQLIQDGEYNFDMLENELPPETMSAFERLLATTQVINNIFGAEIASVDCLSYRGGYPSYDKTTMQVDIITPDGEVAAEVGGGGAYPKALQAAAEVLGDSFLDQPQAYAVGFALGNARVFNAVKQFTPDPQIQPTTQILTWQQFNEICNR